jgi:predicted Zn-dependent peptidase
VGSTYVSPYFHEVLTRVLAHGVEQSAKESMPRLASFEAEHLLGHAPPVPKRMAEHIRGARVEDVQRWLEREFRPQNATLLLVGDLPERPALESMLGWSFLGRGNTRGLGEHLGLVPTPAPSARVGWSAPRAAPTAPQVMLVPQHGALSKLTVSVRGPPLALSRLPEWTTLSKLVERHLYEELRERRGIAYGVTVHLRDAHSAGILSVDTSVRPEHALEVLGLIREVLRRVAQEPLAPERLAQARWDAARHFDRGFTTLDAIADRMELTVTHAANAGFWSAYPGALTAVTGEGVGQLAREFAIQAEAITLAGNVAGLEASLRASGYAVERANEPR